jgi:hypothetical protein
MTSRQKFDLAMAGIVAVLLGVGMVLAMPTLISDAEAGLKSTICVSE